MKMALSHINIVAYKLVSYLYFIEIRNIFNIFKIIYIKSFSENITLKNILKSFYYQQKRGILLR